MTFTDKAVVVTGAGRGLGREYAESFARDGASVVIADVDHDTAESTAADIRGAGGKAIAVDVDVTSKASVDELIEKTVREFGGVHVVVNNAGIWGDLQRAKLTEIDPDYWDFVMAANLKGPLLCSAAAVPTMREQGWGRIINISSIGAWRPSGVYGVSKLGLVQLTHAMATEVGVDGITINAIAPGTINNEATQKQVPPAVIEKLVGQNAVKRPGTAADLYGMMRYLCSDDAGWVTGQTFAVDGGFTFRP
jgi:NAD(P)-dependent dehydrogenase (short-subunit alcohol dehydrogenase family)